MDCRRVYDDFTYTLLCVIGGTDMNEVYILQWFRRHGTICVINCADT